jgi:phospholipid/cholesterol/gamma-HCH transport system ATP-binding protein
MLVELNNIHLNFGPKTILNGVDMTFEAGQVTVVLGASGCGKSTILKLIAGLLKPTQGQILVDAESQEHFNTEQWQNFRRSFSFVFQSGALFDSMSVGENVAFPLTEMAKHSYSELLPQVKTILESVHLYNVDHLYPANLSGGMIKRVALARGVIKQPALILYDEPTAGLDPVSSTAIEQLITSYAKQHNATTIVVSHQHSTIDMADKAYMLYDGQVIAAGTPQQLRSSSDDRVAHFLAGYFDATSQV